MAESAADALVAFSEDDLLRQVPVRALADGQSYYARGRVRGAVRAGDRLAADVVGQEDIYRVVVHITPDGVQGDCTCPLRRQPCKHVAALLWAWVREPGGFADLDAALDELTPADARRLLTEQALVDGEAAKRLLAAADRRDADGSDGADPLASLPRALREAAAAAAPEPLRAVARAVDALWAAGAGASRPEAARASLRLVAAAAPVAARFGLLEGWAEAAAARLRTLPATAQRALAAELAAAVEAAWLSPLPAAAEPLLAAAESAGALPLVAARTWSSLWANRAAALAAAAAAPQTAAPIRPAVAGGSDEPLAALLVEVLDRCGDEDGIIALFHLREVLPAACGPLADRFERRGRLEEAIAAARTAAALAAPAQRPTWRERLAELLSAAGRPAQAVAYLLANLEETPDAGTFQRLHRAASAAGQWDTVRHRACAALAGVPLTEEAAAALVAAGAVREAAEALLRDGPAPPPRSALAVAHALRPDDPDLAFRVALRTLAAILASAPAPPPGTLDLARLVAALADQLDAARAAATAAEAPATQALATALNQLKERLEGAALPDRRPWQPILTVLHACRFPALDVEGWHGKRAP